MLYKTSCFKLAIDLIGPQLASASMHHSLWLPYLLCGVLLLMTFPIILFMPETLYLKRVEAERNEHSPSRLQTYRRFFASKNIRLGLSLAFIAQLKFNVVQIITPFMSVKFGFTIAKVFVRFIRSVYLAS